MDSIEYILTETDNYEVALTELFQAMCISKFWVVCDCDDVNIISTHCSTEHLVFEIHGFRINILLPLP